MKNLAGKKIISFTFLIFSVSLLFLFYSLLFRTQKDISIEENRTLQKVPVLNLKDFLNQNFQNNLETSIGDQLAFSIQIKYVTKQFYNSLTKITSKTFLESTDLTVKNEDVTDVLDDIKSDEKIQPDKNCYIYQEVVAGKLYKIDDSGYIFRKPHAPEEYDFELYDSEMLASVTNPKYLFFILTPESADFNDLKKYQPFEYIKQKMPTTGYDILDYNSFDEYKKYFYQTDHHWNYNGSYVSYCKIMKLLEGNNVQVLEPVRTHEYNTIYNGSLARDNLLRCATEKFTVYEFDLPVYKTFINDVEGEYGYRSYYVSDDDFPHKTYSNHYGMYYGDDHAKVVYDFNQPEKENLLILGTSYTNAINELVASHYNKTHILDFRHYRKQYGERINAQKYMDENNISKMLIIGDISSLGYLK